MMLCSDAWYAPVSVTLHLQGHTSITPIFPVAVASAATEARVASTEAAVAASAVASRGDATSSAATSSAT